MKKNVIITGAGGNLGTAVVDKFLNEGYHVIAVVSPGKVSSIPMREGLTLAEADLSHEKAVQELVEKIVKEFGAIDAALLLAGAYASGSVAETDGISLNKMYSVNFETAYFVARPVFLQMMNQGTGGRIVFTGSRTALVSKDGKNSVAYSLSKSLLFRLAEFLNAEGGSRNVLSSVIVPSTIDTPVNRAAMPKADFSSWVTPDTIADIMSFVVSEKASALRDPVFKVYGKA